MLQRIRIHRWWGARKHCYGCVGNTLFKPRSLAAGGIDIREEHFAFLQGKIPATAQEKMIHAILVHENTHSERQFQAGVWRHQLRYVFSKSFRLKEEKAAYKAQIEQMVRYQFRVRILKIAESMSGEVYRRMVGFDEARRWVSDTVREAEQAFFIDLLKVADEAAKVEESFYEMLQPQSKPSVFKDRMALVLCALVGFVFMFSIVATIEALAGLFK
jgi:hypothetical protein